MKEKFEKKRNFAEWTVENGTKGWKNWNSRDEMNPWKRAAEKEIWKKKKEMCSDMEKEIPMIKRE